MACVSIFPAWLRRPLASLLICVLGATTLPACNDYPVYSLLESFEVRVTKKLSQREPIKLDFLWVIDHSPSMCQEQRDLTAGFSKFIEGLQAAGQVDAQMAVVTVAQLPDREPSTAIVTKVGQFMKKPATTFPPGCRERTRRGCLTDADCTQPFTANWVLKDPLSSMCAPDSRQEQPLAGNPGDWTCAASTAAFALTNHNCSINSVCRYTCASTEECVNMFGPGAKCVQPGGGDIVKGPGVATAGCIFDPDTVDCPPANELPPVLRQSEPLPQKYQTDPNRVRTQLDWFKCIATVGTGQSPEASFEGGLRSAWMALDPNGPNCPKDASGKPQADCQYRQLVRDDAYLIIVVVSDDDDCSVRLDLPLSYGTQEEVKQTQGFIPIDMWNVCQVRGDMQAANQELNEGNCVYRKMNDKNLVCPSDCRAVTAGTPEHAECLAKAEIAMAGSRKYDARYAPVNEFVNRFRSLKSDPARVIFATITGDSLANGGTPVETKAIQQNDRVAYYRSMLRDIGPGQAPYICEGARGESGYGSRYMEVAKAFGDNGRISNICAGSDFSLALNSISELILTRVVKVCLPHPPEYGTDGKPQLKVIRTRGGVRSELEWTESAQTATSPETYYLRSSADCLIGKTETQGQGQTCKSTRDCPSGLSCQEGLCRLYGEALYFTTTPEQGDEVEINYAADLGL